ncbi:DUF7285 family protein [Halorubrum luteum]
MSRSSGEPEPIRVDERGAVEPLAALVALVAVGAALGLYTVAIDDAAPDRDTNHATAALDRVERETMTGGVVDPDRLADLEHETRPDAAVEVVTEQGAWRTTTGADAPDDAVERPGVDVVARPVTVRVAPGENARGVLRVGVYE